MLIYSSHGRTMLIERGIDPVWVERTIAQPDSMETDPLHPDRTSAFRAVPERDGRVLRVVYTRMGDKVRIITVFLDRRRRRGS